MFLVGAAPFNGQSFAQDLKLQANNYSFTRSIILESAGYSVVFGGISEEEGREKALAMAKRALLAKGKAALIDALHKAGIIDGELLANVSTAESITVLDREEITSPISGSGESYAVRIVGEMRYQLNPKLETEFLKLLKSPAMPLTVRLWTIKNEYRAGEQMSFFLTGNRDFYAVLVDVAPDGNMIQLLPNGYRKEAFFERGKTYKLPDPDAGDEFTLDVAPPFGEEKVLLFAGEKPFRNLTQLSGGDHGEIFHELKSSLNDFRSSLLENRSVTSPLNDTALIQGRGNAYLSLFEGRLSLKTVPIK
ncbi:DUF4384 domain-containing protein [bacterium]|nr:DUF4384 domain-containing protein [bacterium]